MATLYLLPNRIAEGDVTDTLPASTLNVLRQTQYFLAENAKSARAYLKVAEHPTPIAQLHIEEIGHEPAAEKIDQWLEPLTKDGHDIAIVSESGCPGIADPGANIVARAQELGLHVRPLVGPSSILLALMASGLDGQHFRFLGYLPIKEPARTEALLAAERQSARGETQLFIETPYRNAAFLDVTGPQEMVRTQTAQAWKKALPALPKVPAIFAILAEKVTRNDSVRQTTHFKKKSNTHFKR